MNRGMKINMPTPDPKPLWRRIWDRCSSLLKSSRVVKGNFIQMVECPRCEGKGFINGESPFMKGLPYPCTCLSCKGEGMVPWFPETGPFTFDMIEEYEEENGPIEV